MDKPIDFDTMFIKMLDIIKMRTRDPRTKVAAILVSEDKRKIHIGWNCMPSKLPETAERWDNRREKHLRVIHAEESAILNAKEDLHGWSCYLSMPPCPSCSRLLIHAGIAHIIYLEEHENNTEFNYDLSREMLAEAGVIIKKYEE